MRFYSESGQSSIEAAVLLPLLFAVFGMLLQPAILLYNESIMHSAAAEGCRLLATNTSDDASVRAYIERRLNAIPALEIFHEGAHWDISYSGASEDANAQVSIVNHAHALPLFGFVFSLAGKTAGDGCIEQRIEAQAGSVPAWAAAKYGPSSWIGAWK